MKKYLYISLALTFFLFVSAEKSFACSCVATTEPLKKQVQKAFSTADLVFSGKVIEIMESPTDKNSFVVKFKILKSWKGPKNREITITTARESSMCGYNFDLAKTYLVYANGTNNDFLTDNCSRTAVYASNGDVKYLVTPKPRKKSR